MTRKWFNEPWRKLYTRITGEWLRVPAVARGIGSELIKYASDDGLLLRLRDGERPGPAVAGMMSAQPRETRIVAGAVDDLLADHYLEVRDGGLLYIRNLKDAQERRSPGAVRQQRWRDRNGGDDGAGDGDVTNDQDSDVTEGVTRNAGVGVTRDVTVTGIRNETRRDETKDEKPSGKPGAQGEGRKKPLPALAGPKRAEALALIAANSGGRFAAVGALGRPGAFALDRVRKAHPDGAIWPRIGRLLADGLDAYLGDDLDARAIARTVEAWAAKATPTAADREQERLQAEYAANVTAWDKARIPDSTPPPTDDGQPLLALPGGRP